MRTVPPRGAGLLWLPEVLQGPASHLAQLVPAWMRRAVPLRYSYKLPSSQQPSHLADHIEASGAFDALI